MVLPHTFHLPNTGTSIPAIGLGTWQSKKGEVGQAVKVALQSGYRHIDCAWIYRNEDEIGAAIKESGVPRKEIFITSKLWNGFHRPEHVELNLDMTLKALGTDYLDLYLMHWHVAFGLPEDGKPKALPKGKDGKTIIDWELTNDFVKTWRAMEALVDKGKVKAIGVSNFTLGRIKHLLTHARIKPAVNQVEVNWSFPQHELFDWCTTHNVLLEAYSPLGSNSSATYLQNPVIKDIADKNGVQPAQVIVGWLVRRGMVVLVKSVTPSRIRSNIQPFALDNATFESLQSQSRALKPQDLKRVGDPGVYWGLDIFDDSAYREDAKL
ncbi:hypothetical protein M422DRAFT_203697 [Sphaerobolus stellatus SS14]|nr:hypothetical protein M422DRAFT_203697 [Sphaerobolus stellatus SS14]